jgi:hypothetical protein
MKNSNFKVNKSVLNFIHARDYFQQNDAESYRAVISNAADKFEQSEYGIEIPRFNMITPDDNMIFGGLLGDYVKLDEEKSGTFRKPWNNLIHFESFENLLEWRLAVALEDNTFTTYSHVTGAKTALNGYEFDYVNLDDWVVETVITLRQNDAIFYRPWVFHSFEEKLLLCYHIIGDED